MTAGEQLATAALAAVALVLLSCCMRAWWSLHRERQVERRAQEARWREALRTAPTRQLREAQIAAERDAANTRTLAHILRQDVTLEEARRVRL